MNWKYATIGAVAIAAVALTIPLLLAQPTGE
jgi:hypothetical protein